MDFYGTPRSDVPTFSCVRIGVNIHADMIAWRAEGDLDLEAGVSTTMSCSREPATVRPIQQLSEALDLLGVRVFLPTTRDLDFPDMSRELDDTTSS